MRLLRWMICLVGLVLFAAAAWAQDEVAVPARVSGLVDCGGELSPADRMHCENVQLDAADEALNRIYGTLMQVLDDRAKAMLLAGQRGWLVYRDKNLELFSSAASPGGQEGMARQIHGLRVLTEARVRELEALYRLFRENGLLSVPEGEDEPKSEPEPVPEDDRFAVFDTPSSFDTPALVGQGEAVPNAAPDAAPDARLDTLEAPEVAGTDSLQAAVPAPAEPAAPETVEPPAVAAVVPQAHSAPAVRPPDTIPSKGVIVLNGKVVRPSDFDIPPTPAGEDAGSQPEGRDDPEAAPQMAVPQAPAPQVAAIAPEEFVPHEMAPEASISDEIAPPEVAAPEAPAEPDQPEAVPAIPLELDPQVPETIVKSRDGLQALLGRHPLRLQWLSSQPLGEVVVEDRDGVLYLSGRQGSANGQGNRLVIEGVVSTVRQDNFTFHGTVTTALDFLNQGKPCTRKGRMWFVRKAGRPFWRLQSITNPCSGVSDYVDIYVEREPESRP